MFLLTQMPTQQSQVTLIFGEKLAIFVLAGEREVVPKVDA